MVRRRWRDWGRGPRSLRWRVWALAVIGALALLVAAGLVTSRLTEVRGSAQSVLGVLEPASDRAAELVVSVSDMDRSVLAYVLSGREADAAAYAVANRRSALAIDRLESLLGDDPEVGPQVAQVRAERADWIAVAAQPALEQMRAGEQAAAARTMTAPEARAAYAVLDADATALESTIDDLRREQFQRLEEIALQLVWVLVGSGLVLLGLLAAGVIVLRRWVTHPLRALQQQMATVSGDHEQVITPSGPPELYEVGVDAEGMRRRLVAEIDAARAAREGLRQDAPLVEAIRRELQADAEPDIPGLSIHGEVQAAEGVLAGDWWDALRLDSGEGAIVLTDVAGHGPAAGVAAMRVRHAMTLALESGRGPRRAMEDAARTFADEDARFATAVIVVIDPATGVLRWCNAGHHPPLVVRAEADDDGRPRVDALDPTGPLLASLDLDGWDERDDRLLAGDVLLVFTDGIVESHAADGDELGVEGLRGLVADARARAGADDPAELVARVVALARERAADWHRDDVTVVAVALAPDTSAPRVGSRGGADARETPAPAVEGIGDGG